MLVLFSTTDVDFIYFYGAFEHCNAVAASLSETLQDKPRGLLGNAYLFAQLERRNALARRNKQIHGVQPFVKGHMGPFKDCSCPNRELEHAGVAHIEAIFPLRDALRSLALGAPGTSGPESLFKKSNGARFVWKPLEKLEGAYGASAHWVALTEPKYELIMFGSQVYNSLIIAG